jgi:hypothetical protein
MKVEFVIELEIMKQIHGTLKLRAFLPVTKSAFIVKKFYTSGEAE